MRKVLALSWIFITCTSCTKDGDDHFSPWQYEQPQYIGGDAGQLLLLDRDIKQNKFSDIHSLLIIKEGLVVFENYYNGYKRKDLHRLNRITQSVFMMAIHSALEEASLNHSDNIIDFFPEYPDVFFNIPQKDRIRIVHLLDHVSGFDWSEWDFSRKANNNMIEAMKQSEDWVKFVLSTPMIREPGMEFEFNSGHALILSSILKKSLDISVKGYFEKRLFHPLGIKEYQWDESPEQTLDASSGLHLNTMDIGKLGYLLLKRGDWYGEQLIPENWVDSLRSVKAQSQFYRVGKNWFKFGINHPVLQSLTINDVLFTWGEGGQFLFIVPHLDMVIVITAGNYSDNIENQMFNILKDYILPSFTYTPFHSVNP